MAIEPKRIKLNPETPSTKKVKTLPLPPINYTEYDIDIDSDHFFDKQKHLDNLTNNEDYKTNNS